MSIALDKQVIQGTDRHYRLTFTSVDLITDDNPEGRVDLAGATVYYRWKRNQNDPNPAEISKSSVVVTEVEILAQTLDPYTMGQADPFLVPSDTDSLPPGWHYWDAVAVLASGKRHKKLPQKVYLVDSVTDLSTPSPAPDYGVTPLTDGDPLVIDALLGDIFSVTLTGLGTRELQVTDPVVGHRYELIVSTGPGSEAMTFEADFKWPGGAAPTITPAASAKDSIRWTYDGTEFVGRFDLDIR